MASICVAGFVTGGARAAMALCAAGDLTGSWKFYGMNANAPDGAGPPANFTNTGGVLSCSLELTQVSNVPIKYNVAGNCQSRGVTKPKSALTLKAGSSFTETTACAPSGALKFVETPVILTILDARIEQRAGSKTNASGVAEAPNVGSGVNYTLFNLVR